MVTCPERFWSNTLFNNLVPISVSLHTWACRCVTVGFGTVAPMSMATSTSSRASFSRFFYLKWCLSSFRPRWCVVQKIEQPCSAFVSSSSFLCVAISSVLHSRTLCGTYRTNSTSESTSRAIWQESSLFISDVPREFVFLDFKSDVKRQIGGRAVFMQLCTSTELGRSCPPRDIRSGGIVNTAPVILAWPEMTSCLSTMTS